jgi:hypothetical protein
MREGTRVDVVDLHHEDLPDPVIEMFRCLQHWIDRMDERLGREEAASGRASAAAPEPDVEADAPEAAKGSPAND